MTETFTLAEAMRVGADSDSGTLRQYAKGLENMAAFHGIDAAVLETMPATLDTFESLFPKVTRPDAHLAAAIEARGWSLSTFKQHRANGRRMIDHVTGAMAQRQELRARRDAWSPLLDRALDLVAGGLMDERARTYLVFFANEARRSGCAPSDMTNTRVQERVDALATYEQRKRMRRGAEVMDDLRCHTGLHNLLPPEPIGPIDTSRRYGAAISEGLASEAARWIAVATTSIPECVLTEHGRKVFMTEQSEGARGIYTAALHRFIRTALDIKDLGLPSDPDLLAFFRPDVIERVLASWIEETQKDLRSALSVRSLYTYVDKLRLICERNSLPEAAEQLRALRVSHPLLKEGRIHGEFMSAETERWCRELLEDEKKVALFEIQHVLYFEQAREALETAAQEGLDLVALSHPGALMRLPRQKRSLARKLLRRARMFGVCAAYAAIGREGVPFRRGNMLALDEGGRVPTFFDHSASTRPRFVIKIPNELLKNGVSLTRRNQSIPQLEFLPGETGSYAFDILQFYFHHIRPLFPAAASSSGLFPGLDAETAYLKKKTFGDWLFECSSEIGLPMRSHNFRHGEASIMINDDPASIDLIALALGDRAETVRRYYAFLHPEKTLKEMQRKRNTRRAGLTQGLRNDEVV
jgi:hypothetical protein